jgi:6-phosphogluconolactonase (cycloisomerase 2 family)
MGGTTFEKRHLWMRFAGRCSKRGAVAFFASLSALLLATATALAVAGQLTQPSGTAGCVSDNGTSGACADGTALAGPRGTALSPDGKNLYVADVFGVAIFNRDTSTGTLSQLAGTAGCVTEDGSSGACADGTAVGGGSGVAVSPDGNNVYLAGSSDAVAIFKRDTTTGALTQLTGTAGCVSQTGTGGACVDGKALDFANSPAVSADGKNVYVGSRQSNAVAVFRRNTTTGALTQLAGTSGCVSETGNGGSCADGKGLTTPSSVAISSDDVNVYVASTLSDDVAVFRRNTSTGAIAQLVGPSGLAGCVSETGTGGTCADGKALDGAASVVVSPDDKSVYVASRDSDAVAVFRRSTTSGVLTQLVGPAGKAGCVSETGTAGACADGKALDNAFWVAASPDGQSVYVAAANSNAVAAFRRDPTGGVLTQLGGSAGCVSEDGSGGACADGKALEGPFSVTVSPDDLNVYVASEFGSSVAVFTRELPPP